MPYVGVVFVVPDPDVNRPRISCIILIFAREVRIQYKICKQNR